MPCVIRQIVEGGFSHHAELAGDEWRFREQVEALEAWLETRTGSIRGRAGSRTSASACEPTRWEVGLRSAAD